MRVPVTAILVLAGALVAMPNVGARTVYKSVMPDGRVVYGERPQPGARKVEKSTLDVDDTGVKPVSRHAADRARQRGLERARALDEALNSLRLAEAELRAAEMAREAGIEPLPGERLGIVGPGSRLTEAYFERQQTLEERVESARQRLDAAQRQYGALR
jgi:hypothetical protein